MNDLSDLDTLMKALTKGLSPAERRKMAKASAQALRKSNAGRIQKNIEPDGKAMAPRLRDKHGKVRTRIRMFKKLRANRHFTAKATSEGFEVGFSSAADGRIAAVHHYGLRDYVSRKHGKLANYKARRLLGFSAADDEAIMDRASGLIRF